MTTSVSSSAGSKPTTRRRGQLAIAAAAATLAASTAASVAPAAAKAPTAQAPTATAAGDCYPVFGVIPSVRARQLEYLQQEAGRHQGARHQRQQPEVDRRERPLLRDRALNGLSLTTVAGDSANPFQLHPDGHGGDQFFKKRLGGCM